ncbi:phosphoribosyltransferase-like protein [Rhodanobacter sp. UC4436_H3]
MASKIDEWELNVERRNKAMYLRGLYETMAIQLYGQYEPTRMVSHRVSRKFLKRVESWIDCFDNDDNKWAAFRSLEYLLFAGQAEFDELYRHAAENIIKPWLIDINSIDIFSPDAGKRIDEAIEQCWICPATDSLRINGFLHVSHMRGKSIRPDWYSLRELGSSSRIDDFVRNNGVKYLIILEDFSGTGNQLSRAIEYAAGVFKGPILAVPLIICAPGHKKMQRTVLSGNLQDVRYDPGLVISEDCLVGRDAIDGQPKLFPKLREAMKDGYRKIKREGELNGKAFGYQGTGSLVVLYSNCPNNTPPIFHFDGEIWRPPFPRSTRV